MALSGVFGKILAGIIALVLFVVIVAASLWAVDYGVQATVTSTSCNIAVSSVEVQERVTRLRHTQPIDFDQCAVVNEGYFANYNIRSERLRIYTEEGGQLVWDSTWL